MIVSYLEHVDESELGFLILESIVKNPEAQQFLIHCHKVVIGIQVLRDFANFCNDVLSLLDAA